MASPLADLNSPLLRALERGVLLGDGANGTWLQAQGFDKTPYDLANLLRPDLVEAVHRAYFEAGSDFVETNTFGANRLRLGHTNWSVRELNLSGADLARRVAGNEKFVVGAIGPAGKNLAPIGTLTEEELFESVHEQALALAEGGVDAFFLETFVDLEEIRIAVRAIQEASRLPIFVTKAFIEDGEALAEGLPGACAKTLEALGVSAIGANCVVGPQRMIDIVRQFSESTSLPVIAFPTPGLPQLVKGQIVYDTSPAYFAKASARLVEEGARIVGGCCGTSPQHIAELRKLIDLGIAKKQQQKVSTAKSAEKKPTPQAEPTRLSEKLGKEFVITVEMDLPRGLNVQKVIEGTQSLKDKGVDLIDISDGARARLRMNPLSISKILQDQVGVEVMMHFACRDRNLLAVQSDLLGAHALGVKNILAITGDPANIGDYPSATSVYDVDAIGLVRILSRFNEGIDLAGNTVGLKCAFTIAVAYNPLAHDLAMEKERLRKKVDNGAHLVYTQPIFESAIVEEAQSFCNSLGVPLFVGILPLRSSRHAEFMHNEVPGIEIPDRIRARMQECATDDDALKIGIDEAQSLSAFLKPISQGLYLMPPFGNHRIAEAVIDAVR